ncbi:helix-turn-helix domain-containing protein [Kineococcus sp. SYSU DK002]|uniref:helix-turn-helix domain-containing protein n=1 Tax=Kineococcus sp. SYSU DK002 TaxID=3383123 RepID=UPI003D7D06E1
MSAGTDTEDLRAAIGAAIRQRRERLGLSTRTLAAQAGVSQSMLSGVENGAVLPSVMTLYVVAEALGAGPADLLPRGEGRLGDGHAPALPASGAGEAAATTLLHVGPGHLLEAYRIEMPGGYRDPAPFRHRGEDHTHVLSGCLDLELDGEVHHLEAGDSLWYDATRQHRMASPHCASVVLLTTARYER